MNCSPVSGSGQYRSSELEMDMAGPRGVRGEDSCCQVTEGQWQDWSPETWSQGQPTWNPESHSKCNRCISRGVIGSDLYF